MPILSNMPGGMDTSDATATAADIISGKSAYANGIKVTGTYDVLEHMRGYCENGAHIEFTATVGDNTLHLRTQTGGYDCVILWGDGAATRAPVDGGNVIHNYAEAGTYHIYIVGRSFARFYVDNQTGKEKYIAVHSMGRWEKDKMTSFSYCFCICAGLTMLPDGLFRYNTKVTNFGSCFRICTKLSLRSDIFVTDHANRFAGKTINFSNCFRRTSFSGTKGSAPQLWNFTFDSVTSAGCFGGSGNSATSLTNYADIPAAWK